MSYLIKGKNGQPVEFNGGPVRAMDLEITKLENLSESDLSFIAVASTEDPDRDNDIVRQSGWDLKFFKRNPVIPWSHNYFTPPIARSMKTWVDKETNRLLFMPKFDATDDFAVKIFNKYRLGFLTSFSVGFRGIDYELRDEDDWWGGYDFKRQELFEVSSVTVPANPHANVYLNGIADTLVKSMADVGYPEVFAKHEDSFLFYPIRDVYQYSGQDVKMMQVAKGVSALLSVPIDDEHPEANDGDDFKTVGYHFDENEFDDELANDWVKENSERTWTSSYYYVKFDEESDQYEVECKPKVMDIQLFDHSIELDKEKTIGNSRRYVGLDEDLVKDIPDDELELDDHGGDDNSRDAEPPDLKQVYDLVERIESGLSGFYEEFNEKWDTIEEKIQTLFSKAVPAIVDSITTLIMDNKTVREAILATHDDPCDNNKTDDLSSDNSDIDSEDTIELDESFMTVDSATDDDPDTIELEFDPDDDDDANKKQVNAVRETITGALKKSLETAVKDLLDNSRSLD